MTGEVSIRQAEVADIERVAALEALVFQPEPYPTYFLRQAHDLWPEWLLLAEADERVVGYALAARGTGETAVILAVGVHPAWRGRRVALDLTRTLLERISPRVASIRLTVHPENRAAISLYDSLGFVTVHREDDYFGPDEPRIVMELKTP